MQQQQQQLYGMPHQQQFYGMSPQQEQVVTCSNCSAAVQDMHQASCGNCGHRSLSLS